MTTWFAIPSARPLAEAKRCFDAWRAIGAKVAATRKEPSDGAALGLDLCISLPTYGGYYFHINILAKRILDEDSDCQIVATGGDDVYPDPAWPAAKVEAEFIEHFGGTLGVMQPVGGNPWSRGRDATGRRIIERVAWGPWLGREWCQRAFMGKGPMPDFGYFQYYGDQELQTISERLNLFHQNRSIQQEHHNWKVVGAGVRPAFLDRAQANWNKDKTLYERREAAGFPDSGLLLA